MTAIFQVGGMGARATKDRAESTGFPSGVAGIPAEVIESLSGWCSPPRAVRTDSGGAGRTRGGLGQATEYWYRGAGSWSLSAMADRTTFAAQGSPGGGPGAGHPGRGTASPSAPDRPSPSSPASKSWSPSPAARARRSVFAASHFRCSG